MQHSFDVDIAKEYGVPEAIILCHFQFWIAKNQANGVNFHDGDYWTYNSMKAFTELFPYLSRKRIEKALNHLRDEGIIKTGNYNQSTYDRTLWYAFTQKGKCILLKREMDDAEKGNGFTDSGKCINTDINHIKNTDNKPYKADAFSDFAGDNKELYLALTEFEEMRKKIKKPMTDRAKTMLINKLKAYPAETAVQMLYQSINHCWADVYELKTDAKQENGRAAVSYDLTAAEDQAAQGAPVYRRRTE